MTPENMIRNLLSGKYGNYSQELYGAFYKGFPIENLRPLLTSDEPEAVSTGSYLVYELGAIARPLVKEIAALLDNPEPQVRSDAIIALRECAGKEDGLALGNIFLKLDDPDPFVRRGAMGYVRYSSVWQLKIAITEAGRMRPSTIFGEFSKNPLRYIRASKDQLEKLITNPNSIARRFGVGIACRAKLVIDKNYLDVADNCDDEEGLEFVRFTREQAFPRYAIYANIENISPSLSFVKHFNKRKKFNDRHNKDMMQIYYESSADPKYLRDLFITDPDEDDFQNRSFELENCQDEFISHNKYKIVQKLMQLERGVFYPFSEIAYDDNNAFPNIEVCRIDYSGEAAEEIGYVSIILKDESQWQTKTIYTSIEDT